MPPFLRSILPQYLIRTLETRHSYTVILHANGSGVRNIEGMSRLESASLLHVRFIHHAWLYCSINGRCMRKYVTTSLFDANPVVFQFCALNKTSTVVPELV